MREARDERDQRRERPERSGEYSGGKIERLGWNYPTEKKQPKDIIRIITRSPGRT